jgi:energy-converting hydrogenase B subunit A
MGLICFNHVNCGVLIIIDSLRGLFTMFITRIFYGIAYFIVLIFEIIKATLDVATRTVNGKVEPVIVEIPTVLKRPISQTILANSITLTPGTLSVDLDSENQVLKVATIVTRKNEDVIPFEPYIKGMLE